MYVYTQAILEKFDLKSAPTNYIFRVVESRHNNIILRRAVITDQTMDFRIAAPHRDSAEDAVAGTGARTDEAAGLTYAELMPKLMKSSVPLAILVGLRYLLEYSVPILLYLGWLMIYNNLAYDFAGHLVFKSGLETYSLIRELLRFMCNMTNFLSVCYFLFPS